MTEEINIPFRNDTNLPRGFSSPKITPSEYMEKERETIEKLKRGGISVLPSEKINQVRVNAYLHSFLLFLGLIAIAGGILYLGYYDKIQSSLTCGNYSLTCEPQTCTCTPTICPSISCGSCNCPEFPNELTFNLNITNGSI